MSKRSELDSDRQRRPLKRKRAGVELSRSEVREIKAERKKLRKEMRKQKVYSKREFEMTASSMGLYFDKGRWLALWLWLLHRGVIWGLLAAMLLTFGAMYLFSRVTEMRGHFTINLSDNLTSQGFELSDTVDFANPTSRIYGTPVEDAPCISIADLPEDIDLTDGSHNGRNYFAHTFYLAKRGEGVADVQFTLKVNSESKSASSAIWVLLFEDGVPTVYARANGATGESEALPAWGNDRLGYVSIPFSSQGLPTDQYEVVRETDTRTYYRLIPRSFEGDTTVRQHSLTDVRQDEVHKYTVVIWLEGDDPDCTDELIGGHIGMQMDFELIEAR